MKCKDFTINTFILLTDIPLLFYLANIEVCVGSNSLNNISVQTYYIVCVHVYIYISIILKYNSKENE